MGGSWSIFNFLILLSKTTYTFRLTCLVQGNTAVTKLSSPPIYWPLRVDWCLVSIHRTCWVNYGPSQPHEWNPCIVSETFETPLPASWCLRTLTGFVGLDQLAKSICIDDLRHNTWDTLEISGMTSWKSKIKRSQNHLRIKAWRAKARALFCPCHFQMRWEKRVTLKVWKARIEKFPSFCFTLRSQFPLWHELHCCICGE